MLEHYYELSFNHIEVSTTFVMHFRIIFEAQILSVI